MFVCGARPGVNAVRLVALTRTRFATLANDKAVVRMQLGKMHLRQREVVVLARVHTGIVANIPFVNVAWAPLWSNAARSPAKSCHSVARAFAGSALRSESNPDLKIKESPASHSPCWRSEIRCRWVARIFRILGRRRINDHRSATAIA